MELYQDNDQVPTTHRQETQKLGANHQDTENISAKNSDRFMKSGLAYPIPIHSLITLSPKRKQIRLHT